MQGFEVVWNLQSLLNLICPWTSEAIVKQAISSVEGYMHYR